VEPQGLLRGEVRPDHRRRGTDHLDLMRTCARREEKPASRRFFVALAQGIGRATVFSLLHKQA
jgi:hypothetical protein